MRCLHHASLATVAICSSQLTLGFGGAEASTSESRSTDVFGDAWAEEFSKGSPGCTAAKAWYQWRSPGFGSNMNYLLETWVHGISVRHWEDLAVLFKPRELPKLQCGAESGVPGLAGWDCLFSPMPHLCTFKSVKEWQEHMVLAGVPETQRFDAGNLTFEDMQHVGVAVSEALRDSDIDHVGAFGAMVGFMWDHVTPWLREAVDAVIQRTVGVPSGQSPFVGIHVRRGDKVKMAQFNYIRSETYMQRAAKHCDSGALGALRREDVRGIWVASDDPTVLSEVRDIAPKYFPNVKKDNVVGVSGGSVNKKSATPKVHTHTAQQGFAELANLFADLQQLSEADIFVGTFSSNFGRIVYVLRESKKKARSSTISLERPYWYPERRTLLGAGSK